MWKQNQKILEKALQITEMQQRNTRHSHFLLGYQKKWNKLFSNMEKHYGYFKKNAL